MNTENKKRVEWIDIARGITIIAMIYAHSDLTAASTPFIFAFHMPIFFILSGYLYKEPKDFKTYVKKSIKKLLLPYGVTCALLAFLRICRYMLQPEYYDYCGRKIIALKTIISSFVGFGCGPAESAIHFPFYEAWSVGALWFFLTFLWAVILFAVIMKLTKGWNEIERALLFLTISMLGLAISFYGYWLPLDLDIAFFALIFMYVGYVLRQYLDGEMHALTIVLLICFYIIASMKYNSIGMSVRSVSSALTIPLAIAGSILVMELSKWLERVLPHIIIAMIVWFGRSAMTIVCVHTLQFEIIPYAEIVKWLRMDNHYVLIVNIINYVSIIIVVEAINRLKAIIVDK